MDLKNYHFIDPSAGTGVFYNLMPENSRIGVDILPTRPEFIGEDYLTWKQNRTPRSVNVLITGGTGILGSAVTKAYLASMETWRKSHANGHCNNWIDLFTVDTRKERLCGQERMEEAYFLQRTFYNEPPELVRDFSKSVMVVDKF